MTMERDRTPAGARIPLRILVIDDYVPLAEALCRILQSDGHRVTVALGGKDGIEAFRTAYHSETPFDVVIVDYSMPDVDGLEVAARVKEMTEAASLILVTAYQLEPDELPRHVDAVLVKPAGALDVRAALARARSRSSG
jgi:CheY-like chemotaxis protein